MLLRWLGKALVAAMFGFAALVVCAMLVRGYGGPGRSMASAVVRLASSDIAGILRGSAVWMQQNL